MALWKGYHLHKYPAIKKLCPKINVHRYVMEWTQWWLEEAFRFVTGVYSYFSHLL